MCVEMAQAAVDKISREAVLVPRANQHISKYLNPL